MIQHVGYLQLPLVTFGNHILIRHLDLLSIISSPIETERIQGLQVRENVDRGLITHNMENVPPLSGVTIRILN